jgi:Flp pilus assembly protein TadD
MVQVQEALAKLGLEQNDLDLATKSAEALIAAQPALPQGYNVRAVVKVRRKDVSGAEADLKKAIELAPRDPIAYTRLGEIRTLQRAYPEAEKLLERALEVAPTFTEALAGISQIYVLEKKPTSALLNRIQDQITRAPNNSAYYQMLGQILSGLRDFEKAESAFEKAVELDHNNLTAFVMLATTQEARGSLPQALASAQRSVQQNPRDVRSYTLLGMFEEKSGDWQKAQEAYQKALQIEPGSPLVANNLAFLLLDHGGNADLALSLAQTARSKLPDSPTTADTLAWAYIRKGVFGSALPLLEKAVQQAPGIPDFRYHLGVAYQHMNNTAAAATQFRQVLKMAPGYVKSEEIRKYLANPGKG